MSAIPPVAVLLAALLAPLLAAAQPSALDKKSPFFQQLMAATVPTEVDELLFVHDVLRLAQEHHHATRVYGIAERTVLAGMLGEAAPPVTGTLAAMLAADPPPDDLEKLRLEARRRSIVAVAEATRPSPLHRSFRNYSGLTVTGFEVLVAVPAAGEDLLCKYEGSLEARAIAAVACTPQAGSARLTQGPYAVMSVRVAPGSYRTGGPGSGFSNRQAATRARLAALDPRQLERPRRATPREPDPDLEKAAKRWEAGISLALIGLGFVVGWPIGTRHPHPGRAAGGIAMFTAVLVVLATVAVPLGLFPGARGADNTGGVATLLSIGLVLGTALLATAAWLGFNLGVLLGAWLGSRRRRRTAPV